MCHHGGRLSLYLPGYIKSYDTIFHLIHRWRSGIFFCVCMLLGSKVKPTQWSTSALLFYHQNLFFFTLMWLQPWSSHLTHFSSPEICAFEMLGKDEICFQQNRLMLSEVILVVTGAFCRDYLWVLQRCRAGGENNRWYEPVFHRFQSSRMTWMLCAVHRHALQFKEHRECTELLALNGLCLLYTKRCCFDL